MNSDLILLFGSCLISLALNLIYISFNRKVGAMGLLFMFTVNLLMIVELFHARGGSGLVWWFYTIMFNLAFSLLLIGLIIREYRTKKMKVK